MEPEAEGLGGTIEGIGAERAIGRATSVAGSGLGRASGGGAGTLRPELIRGGSTIGSGDMGKCAIGIRGASRTRPSTAGTSSGSGGSGYDPGRW